MIMMTACRGYPGWGAFAGKRLEDESRAGESKHRSALWKQTLRLGPKQLLHGLGDEKQKERIELFVGVK